jgi:putative transposase
MNFKPFYPMSEKYRNKYRIASARLKNWDYSSNGAYFITICTQNREHFFGEIVETQFIASEIGQLAKQYWLEIPNQFPFVELGNFIIMPNHVHGILIIDKNANGDKMDNADIGGITDTVETRLIGGITNTVETRLIASLPNQTEIQNHKNGGFAGLKNPMFHENISRIIRWYKGRCSFEIRQINPNFGWQPRFHDHIIRDAKSFEKIQNYIVNNPLHWNKDKFFDNN